MSFSLELGSVCDTSSEKNSLTEVGLICPESFPSFTAEAAATVDTANTAEAVIVSFVLISSKGCLSSKFSAKLTLGVV